MSPRRKARPRARRRVDPRKLAAIRAILAVGPDFGLHDAGLCGRHEEREARHLARLWAEYRQDILATSLLPAWAVGVLDRGEDPEPPTDPRLDDEDARAWLLEHARRLAAVARAEYQRLMGRE